MVATTAIFEAEFTDICFAGFIENGFTNRKHCVLLIFTPHHVAGNITLLEESIDHETVAGVNCVFVTKVEDDQIFIDAGATFNLFT